MTKGLTMRLIPALMMLGFAGVAGASGFALQNQSGSANGNAFAGAAAAAEDASTIYFNPAGMTYLPKGHTISLSGTVLDRSIKFCERGLLLIGGPRKIDCLPLAELCRMNCAPLRMEINLCKSV